MINFFIFALAGIGITNIIVNASILDIPRDFLSDKSEFAEKLLSCMLCSGFWVGILLWSFMPGQFDFFGIIAPVCSGAIISLLSSFYDIFTDYLMFNDEGDE